MLNFKESSSWKGSSFLIKTHPKEITRGLSDTESKTPFSFIILISHRFKKMPKKNKTIHHVQITNIIVTSHHKDITFLLLKHRDQIFEAADHQQEIGLW